MEEVAAAEAAAEVAAEVAAAAAVASCADTYVPGPPCRMYGVRVPASCVLYVPEAQGSLPSGGDYCTYPVTIRGAT